MEEEHGIFSPLLNHYSELYSQYHNTINFYQSTTGQRARMLKNKLQRIYLFILRHRELYYYYKESLRELDDLISR